MTKNEYFRKLGELCDKEEISEDTFNEMMCVSDSFCEEKENDNPVLKISKVNIKSETFCTTWNNKVYCVDICEDMAERGAWLYNASYGIKAFMFGTSVEQDSRDEFLDMVFSNLPDYIEDDAEEYED